MFSNNTTSHVIKQIEMKEYEEEEYELISPLNDISTPKMAKKHTKIADLNSFWTCFCHL